MKKEEINDILNIVIVGLALFVAFAIPTIIITLLDKITIYEFYGLSLVMLLGVFLLFILPPLVDKEWRRGWMEKITK